MIKPKKSRNRRVESQRREGDKLQGQSRQLACCWKNIPHARPTMCLISSEVISVLDLLLDITVMSNGKEVHMTNSRILQWSRHIGVVHLLCIRSFLHGGLILGRHILQGQQVIFSRDGSCRGLCSDQTYMRKGLVSMRRLDHITPSRFKEVNHRYAVQSATTIRATTSAYGCR